MGGMSMFVAHLVDEKSFLLETGSQFVQTSHLAIGT
jgi:hypothetical protein